LVARTVVDEGARLRLELRLQGVGAVGLRAQLRAAGRGADDGEVDARLLEARAQDLVLDRVECALNFQTKFGRGGRLGDSPAAAGPVVG
jgi:hypothetical protein